MTSAGYFDYSRFFDLLHAETLQVEARLSKELDLLKWQVHELSTLVRTLNSDLVIIKAELKAHVDAQFKKLKAELGVTT